MPPPLLEPPNQSCTRILRRATLFFGFVVLTACANAQEHVFGLQLELHSGISAWSHFRDPEPELCCYASGWVNRTVGQPGVAGRVLVDLPHGLEVFAGYRLNSFTEREQEQAMDYWGTVYQQDFGDGLTEFAYGSSHVDYKVRTIEVGLAYQLAIPELPFRPFVSVEGRLHCFTGKTKLEGQAENLTALVELVSGPFSGRSSFATERGTGIGAGGGVELPLGRLSLVWDARYVAGQARVTERTYEWSIHPTGDGGTAGLGYKAILQPDNRVVHRYVLIGLGLRYRIL